MNFIDVLLVILWVLVLGFTVRKGFLKGMIQLGCWVGSAFGAGWLGTLVARPAYVLFAQRAAQNLIAQKLQGVPVSSVAQTLRGIQTVLAALPSAFLTLSGLSSFSGTIFLENHPELVGSPEELAVALEGAVFAPVIILAFQAIARAILFVPLFWGLRFLGRRFVKITRLPILKQTDKLLAGVAGFLKGAVVMLFATLVLRILAAYSVLPSSACDLIMNSFFVRASRLIWS